jgi:hypothetical protein
MNALQQFKQKGRILRKLMAEAFNTEVKLSQAYETIAAMEGCTSWNEFSAQLAGSSAQPAALSAAATRSVALPAIRAIFRTVDGKAEAQFDASSWFAQASEQDIEALMTEKPRMAPIGFELSYGGMNGFSDAVAEFVAASDDKVRQVYTYIKSLSDVGGDCGGSDCYIDAYSVQRYMVARSEALEAEPVSAPVAAGSSLVLDVQLGGPGHAPLRAKICELIRQDAAHRHDSGDYRPTLPDDIEEALAAFNVVATGEDGAFAASVYDLMRQALVSRAVEVATPAPVYERLQILEVMMQDIVGNYDVPDDVPEWQWVQANAAFSHRENGKDGGVWEFMVNVDCAMTDMPEALKQLFEQARRHKAVWVLFNQGT